MIERLKNIDKETYLKLKSSGMFWEFHPEATGDWATDSGLIRSSHDWLKEPEFKNLTILDHDGFDRANLDESMAELITRKEFDRRLVDCTISWPVKDMLAYADIKEENCLAEFTD
jgi:hypothetical protein